MIKEPRREIKEKDWEAGLSINAKETTEIKLNNGDSAC